MPSEELTGREREVLRLVDGGLTNDQIAERLGISIDGVKYHVSQAMAKLGVVSRYDAAEIAQRQRPPWSAIPLALRFALGALAMGSIVILVVLLWGVLQSGSGDGTTVAGLTAPQVVDRVKQAVSRDGQVLHSQARSDGGSQGIYTIDYWIDAAGNAMRSTYTPIDVPARDGTPTVRTVLYVDNYFYYGDQGATRENATPCPGISPAWLAYYFYCLESNGVSPDVTVEQGDWDGESAIVLVLEYNAPATDAAGAPAETTAISNPSSRFYLDPTTFLPIASAVEYTFNGTSGIFSALSYENEFLPRTQELLATLDPKSLGYGTYDVDKIGPLANEVPVYWFGENYDSDDPLYALVLAHVDTVPTDRAAARLTYGNRNNFAPGIVITLWRPDDWAATAKTPIRMLLDDPSCVSQSTQEIGDREFTVYRMTRITYPVPSKGSSTQADCWWRGLDSGSDVAIEDTGSLLVWQTDDVVVEISAVPPGYYEDFDLLTEVVANLRKY